jgi:hypothetical protein
VLEEIAAVIIVPVTGSEWFGEGGGRKKGGCNEGGCEKHFEAVDGLIEDNCQRVFLRK